MTITIKKEQICDLVVSDQTICIKEIVYIQGEGNYSKFYLNDGRTIISCRTLKYFESFLTERGFIRPSKSAIVNINAIQTIDFNRQKAMRLINDQNITISRRQIKPLKDLFKAAAQQS
jgi:two-component system LytT family response regulator